MLQNIIIVIMILVVFICGIVIYDSHRFVVKEYTVHSSKLKEDHSFLFISDLHSRSYGKDNSKLFDAINKYNVEGALFAGDIMTANVGTDNSNAIYFVNRLSKMMPIYYGIGNHELRADTNRKKYGDLLDVYLKGIDESKVKFMDNESRNINEISVHGLSIDEPYYIKFVKLNMDAGYVEKKLGTFDKDKFNILLAHDPEYAESYACSDADLILSGHFHGGIAKIPGIGGVISPRLVLFPKYSGGLYKVGNSTLIVSNGLGMHSMPIRFLNPSELVVIHLKKD